MHKKCLKKQISVLILNAKCDLSCRFQPLPTDRVQRGYRGTLSFIFIKTFRQAPITYSRSAFM